VVLGRKEIAVTGDPACGADCPFSFAVGCNVPGYNIRCAVSSEGFMKRARVHHFSASQVH